MRPFTILLTQYTDCWDPFLPYYLSTLASNCVLSYYLSVLGTQCSLSDLHVLLYPCCANLYTDKVWTLKWVHSCCNYYGQIKIMIKRSSFCLKYLTICEWHLKNPKAARLAMDSKITTLTDDQKPRTEQASCTNQNMTTTLSDDQKLRTEQLHAQIKVRQPLCLMNRNWVLNSFMHKSKDTIQ